MSHHPGALADRSQGPAPARPPPVRRPPPGGRWSCLFVHGQLRPVGLFRTDHRRAIDLGRAIDVGGNAHGLHGGNHRRRGRCRRSHHAHLLVKGLTLCLGGAGNHRHDDRCAAEMGDTVLGKGRINASAVGPRINTWVPANRVTVPGKHQPLQWNRGGSTDRSGDGAWPGSPRCYRIGPAPGGSRPPWVGLWYPRCS